MSPDERRRIAEHQRQQGGFFQKLGRQLNPLDSGASWSTTPAQVRQVKAAKPKPADPRSNVAKAWNQVNVFDRGKSFNNNTVRTPQKPARQVAIPKYTGRLFGLPQRIGDVFEANSPQDVAKRQKAGQPTRFQDQNQSKFRRFINPAHKSNTVRDFTVSAARSVPRFFVTSAKSITQAGTDKTRADLGKQIEVLKRDPRVPREKIAELEGKFGKINDFTFDPNSNRITRFLMGSEKVETAQKRYQGNTEKLRQVASQSDSPDAKLLNKIAPVLAFTGTGAAIGLDAPLGGGSGQVSKKLVKSLAKAGTKEEVEQIIKKQGIKLAEDEASDVIKRLATTKSKKEVSKIINSITKKTDGAIPKIVKADDLKLGSDTKGVTLDKGTVLGYENMLEDGKKLDPLVVRRGEDGRIYIQDGQHRLQAYKNMGIKDIPVTEQKVKTSKLIDAIEGRAGKAAKSNPAVGDAFRRTGSTDPYELIKQTLADTTSKKEVRGVVDELFGDTDNAIKNNLTKQLTKAKTPEEVQALVTEAAQKADAAVGTQAQEIEKAVADIPAQADVQTTTPTAPDVGVAPDNRTVDASVAGVNPTLPAKIQEKIDKGIKLTKSEEAKVQATYDKAIEKASKINAKGTADNAVISGVKAPISPEYQTFDKELATRTFRSDGKKLKEPKEIVRGNVGLTKEFQDTLIKAVKSGELKDVSRFDRGILTSIRVVDKAISNPEVKKQFMDETLRVVSRNDAASKSLLNELNTEFKKTILKNKLKNKKDRELVSWMIENADDPNAIEFVKSTSKNADKVIAQAEFFTGKFGEFRDNITRVLADTGNKDIGYIKNYLPQLQEKNIGEGLRNIFKAQGEAIPPYLKPSKPGAFFAKTREGTQAGIRDPYRLYQTYIDSYSKLVTHADSVAHLKNVESALNEAQNVTKRNLDNVRGWIDDLVRETSGAPTELDAAVDKAPIIGSAFRVISRAQSRIAKNLINGSLTVATKNLIPNIMAAAGDPKNFMLGLGETLAKGFKRDALTKIDGIEVPFLVSREGTQRAYRTGTEKFVDITADIAQLPDMITAHTIATSRYKRLIDQGVDKAEAVIRAGEETGRIMADRSTGQGSRLFRNKSLSPFTMFQTEVNNQWQSIAYDIVKNKELVNSGPEAMRMVAGLAFAGYLYNQAYESIAGQRPAIDPIGAFTDAMEKSKDPETSTADVIASLVGSITNQLPGGNLLTGTIAGVTGNENFSGSGSRSPVDSTIIASTLDNAINGNPEQRLRAALTFAPPAAGGQINKTLQGLKAGAEGGMFKQDKVDKETGFVEEGEKKFSVQGTGDRVKAALFGPYASKGGQDYIKSGFKTEEERGNFPTPGSPAEKAAIDKKKRAKAVKDFEKGLSKEDRGLVKMGSENLKDAYNAGEIDEATYNRGRKLLKQRDNLSNRFTAPKGTSKESYKVLEQLDSYDPETKQKWENNEIDDPNTRAIVEKLNKKLPSGLRNIENHNQVAKAYAEIEQDWLKADKGQKWSKMERDNRVKKFWKEVTQVSRGKDVTEVYKLSDQNIMRYLEEGAIPPDTLKAALDMDNELYNAGLASLAFGKRLRNYLGVPLPEKYSSGSGGGSSGKKEKEKKVPGLNGFLSIGSSNVPNAPKLNTKVTGSRIPTIRLAPSRSSQNTRIKLKL